METCAVLEKVLVPDSGALEAAWTAINTTGHFILHILTPAPSRLRCGAATPLHPNSPKDNEVLRVIAQHAVVVLFAGFFGLHDYESSTPRCRPEIVGYGGGSRAWTAAHEALLQGRPTPEEDRPSACGNVPWFLLPSSTRSPSATTAEAEGQKRPRQRRTEGYHDGSDGIEGRIGGCGGNRKGNCVKACSNHDSVWSPFAGTRAVVLFTGAGGPSQLEWLAQTSFPECNFRPFASEILSLADAVLLDLSQLNSGSGSVCEFPAELQGIDKPDGQLWLIARPESGTGQPPAFKSGTEEAEVVRRRADSACGGPKLWRQVDGQLFFSPVVEGRTWSKVLEITVVFLFRDCRRLYS